MGYDLGIGLRRKDMAARGQHLAQFAKVFDDAVVNDSDLAGGVRMGVVLCRLAVGCPARVANADRASQGLGREAFGEVAQFALGAPARDMSRFQRGDASRIIPAIFEPLQRFDNLRGNRACAENADNSTHSLESPFGCV